MPQRKLRDIVRNQSLVHVDATETVAETVKRMQAAHVGCALVLDGNELKGIFTGSNLLNRVINEGRNPHDVPVGEVMTPGPVCLKCSDLGFEAVRRMREHGFRHVVVNRAEGGYGVVSVRDFPGEELDGYNEELAFENKLWEEM
jgi:signal-transduction protein with cAMP-binding, CBS, and nucleotidyltransferase domain